MSWVYFALLAPLLWSVSNYIDQYVVRYHLKDKAYCYPVVAGLTNILFIPIFWVLYPDVVDVTPLMALGVMLAASLWSLQTLPYALALSEQDASAVAPVYQTIPLFTLLLGWILYGESLTGIQYVASVLIIVGGMGGMWDFKARRLPLKPFFLILFAALLCAVYYVALRGITGVWPWYKITFWAMCSWFTISVVALSVKESLRTDIVGFLRKSPRSLLALGVGQQAFDILATMSFVSAFHVAPTTSHVTLVGSIHVLYLLVMGGILCRIFPRYIDRIDIDWVLLCRLGFVGMIIGGIYLLQ